MSLSTQTWDSLLPEISGATGFCRTTGSHRNSCYSTSSFAENLEDDTSKNPGKGLGAKIAKKHDQIEDTTVESPSNSFPFGRNGVSLWVQKDQTILLIPSQLLQPEVFFSTTDPNHY